MMIHAEANGRTVKALVDTDVEQIDASDGWEMLQYVETSDPARRIVAVTRRSDSDTSFVLLARVVESDDELGVDDPWCDLGGGD